ncbi:hypothetical protein HDU78_011023 [Chytriomyces hyalinus]|nr:hypothetical protein HDU78_011023 [Chytriomyces hyalinus]
MNSNTHNSELGGILLSLTTIHLFPQWFKMFCGILSNKNLLHCVKPNLLFANPPHARTHAQALAQDPTLRSYTYISRHNFPDIYFSHPFTAYTFPGLEIEQYNVMRLITINLDPSFAATIPETNFAYDMIKYLNDFYLATASNSTVIQEKMQNWLNLRMTSSQTIHGYWHTVTTQLTDLKNLQLVPEIANLIEFHRMKKHVIDRLHDAFGSVKPNIHNDPDVRNEASLLRALLEQERGINWVPTTVALATTTTTASSSSTTPATTATQPSRGATNNNRRPKSSTTPYQRVPHALEQRDPPSKACPLCTAANVTTRTNHWKTQCYRNQNYLQECLKPLPANVELIPFNRVGRAAQSNPDVQQIYTSRSLPVTLSQPRQPRQQQQQQPPQQSYHSQPQPATTDQLLTAIQALTNSLNTHQQQPPNNNINGATAPFPPSGFY